MASTTIAFPQTYDPVQAGPNYSASDFRLTAGAALAVPDGSGFGGIQGVRADSPSPLATIDGTTVTVAAHMGWLCPWTGSGCYTYALPEPQQVTVDSTTGSYKIAVVLEDKAAGHGSGERASLRSYPSTTSDSMIPGLVLARVDQGVASDTVPRIRPSSTIMVSTPSDLQRIAAADGIQAELADGARYERRNGIWVSVTRMGWTPVTPGGGWQWGQTDDPHLCVAKWGNLVELQGVIGRTGGWKSGWVVAIIPAGYRPPARVWMTSSRRNVSHLYADPDGTLGVANDTLTGAAFADLFIHATWLI